MTPTSEHDDVVERPIPTPDAIGMVRECADWDAKWVPLTGGDVIALMIRFGLVKTDEAKEAYFGVLKQLGVTGPDCGEPVLETFVTDDDKIPF
jgi:hypothetical protein